ncbi:MAG TPA: TfoX/Sxy family protein [Candidatus Binatia bacterium]|jgi:DNA transformation protein
MAGTADASFKDFVLDQLQELPDLECRSMFGGHGLYQEESFFGIVFKGRLYFKTDPKSAGPYLNAGMKPYRPNEKQTLKNYYEVPVDVIEDRDRLAAWARESLRVAKR